VPFGLATDTTSVKLMGNTLVRWGTEEQKQRLLPRILSGDDFWPCFLLAPDVDGRPITRDAARHVPPTRRVAL
jgi:alkylation response protein AidB-like acyl-CoA dehydrogenase